MLVFHVVVVLLLVERLVFQVVVHEVVQLVVVEKLVLHAVVVL